MSVKDDILSTLTDSDKSREDESGATGWRRVDLLSHLAAYGGYPPAAVRVRRSGEVVILPAPQSLERPLGRLLQERRSRRCFTSLALELAVLATLLEAGLGVTSHFDEDSLRMAGISDPDSLLQGRALFSHPSPGAVAAAGACVLVLRVVGLESGLYRLDVAQRTLTPRAIGRPEVLAESLFGARDWTAEAAAVVILTNRIVARGHYRHPYQLALLETGHIAQSLLLAAGALDLAACEIGEVGSEPWFDLVGGSLNEDIPLLAIAFGHRSDES